MSEARPSAGEATCVGVVLAAGGLDHVEIVELHEQGIQSAPVRPDELDKRRLVVEDLQDRAGCPSRPPAVRTPQRD